MWRMQRALSVPALPAAAKIQNDLRILTERLARINDNLARKISSRNEYDKTIQETEGAYAKVRGRCLAAVKRHHTAADPALSPRRVGPTLSLWRSICEVCPEPQVMVSFTYHGYILTVADHGELANAAARAQAGVHQLDEEDAGLLVSSV